MAFSGDKEVLLAADGDRAGAADARKAVGRRRLAEALRANLRRRKAQSRDRQAHDAAQGEAPQDRGESQED
jgi:hypothetical protein